MIEPVLHSRRQPVFGKHRRAEVEHEAANFGQALPEELAHRAQLFTHRFRIALGHTLCNLHGVDRIGQNLGRSVMDLPGQALSFLFLGFVDGGLELIRCGIEGGRQRRFAGEMTAGVFDRVAQRPNAPREHLGFGCVDRHIGDVGAHRIQVDDAAEEGRVPDLPAGETGLERELVKEELQLQALSLRASANGLGLLPKFVDAGESALREGLDCIEDIDHFSQGVMRIRRSHDRARSHRNERYSVRRQRDRPGHEYVETVPSVSGWFMPASNPMVPDRTFAL
jgi:hypothetical protein